MRTILYARITRATDAKGGKKDTFRKTSQILPADNTSVYTYTYNAVYIYVHTGVGLNGPCVGMHPNSRVGLPTRVVCVRVCLERDLSEMTPILCYLQ